MKAWSILQYFRLENQFSVLMRVTVLHRFYCIGGKCLLSVHDGKQEIVHVTGMLEAY